MNNWYAIFTKPRKESTVETHLENQGIKTFFPKIKERKFLKGKKHWLVGPLFPRYIFAYFDVLKFYNSIKYTRGVSKIVSFGDSPTPVDEAIIETISNHAEDDIVTINESKLEPGDRVEIINGPLEGLQGIFEQELSSRDRVLILLETIAMQAKVDVSKEYLRKLASI